MRTTLQDLTSRRTTVFRYPLPRPEFALAAKHVGRGRRLTCVPEPHDVGEAAAVAVPSRLSKIATPFRSLNCEEIVLARTAATDLAVVTAHRIGSSMRARHKRVPR